MTNAPCKTCIKRCELCHAHCEEYTQWVEHVRAERAALRSNDADGFLAGQVQRKKLARARERRRETK